MNPNCSLDSLFKQKIFRIPDYQRGYAWQHEQINDFWEDLINPSEKRCPARRIGASRWKQILTIATSVYERLACIIIGIRVYHVVLTARQRLTARSSSSFRHLWDFPQKCCPTPKTSQTLDILSHRESECNRSAKPIALFAIKPTGDQFQHLQARPHERQSELMTTCAGSKIIGEEGGERHSGNVLHSESEYRQKIFH